MLASAGIVQALLGACYDLKWLSPCEQEKSMSDQTGWIDNENGTTLSFANLPTRQVRKLYTT